MKHAVLLYELMQHFTPTKSLVAEPEGSTPNPTTEHEPEPTPPTSHPHNQFPPISFLVFLVNTFKKASPKKIWMHFLSRKLHDQTTIISLISIV
jgi:hypothetical protein